MSMYVGILIIKGEIEKINFRVANPSRKIDQKLQEVEMFMKLLKFGKCINSKTKNHLMIHKREIRGWPVS